MNNTIALHFIDNFILPHETEFEKGFYGQYDHAITEYDKSDNGNYYQGKLLGTKFGIDAASYHGDPSNLTKETATDEYIRSYWNKFNCDSLDGKLKYAFMDVCVNSGPGRAQQFLKQSGGDVDKFLDLRDQFYKNLADKRPASKKYLSGWLNRNSDLRQWIKSNN